MNNIIRRDPTEEFARMNRMLDRWFGDLNWPAEARHMSSGRSLPLDVYEKDGNLVVKAAIPGVSEEDLEVNIQDGVLTIRGETKHEEQTEDTKVYVREFSYGSFSRSIRLPENVDTDNANATFDNGFLWIELPKIEPEQPESRRLEVKRRSTERDSSDTPETES